MLAGFLIRNCTESLGSSLYIIDSGWSSTIRSSALVVILLRASLGMDIENVKRLSWSVFRLAIIPNLIEATIDAALAVTLFDMPVTNYPHCHLYSLYYHTHHRYLHNH